jgi:hypothetical protein
LPLILAKGIVNKHHPDASAGYINIGNPEIIDVRSTTPVKIDGYGMVGDYVPFYFTPKSVMLLNIVTGYWHPKVLKRNRSEIVVIRCLIEKLVQLPKWFFTNGQGNDMASEHYNELSKIDKIDWDIIHHSDFSKSDGDYDRPRRYQAEFLVHEKVPLDFIESLNVFNQQAADYVKEMLRKNQVELAVNIVPEYFF